ncbi:MAG TPA: trypsin-like peptidase domain-containing protein [Terriglobales bacterium]|nr:trypsin-like peptidase domain-containing protein [Terriglobales bacterium]
MDEAPEPPPETAMPEAAPATVPAAGKASRSRALLAVAVALVLSAGLLGGWVLGRAGHAADPGGLTGLSGSIAAAERRVAPAVVKIQVESARRGRTTFRLPPGLGLPARPRMQHSLGSGLIVDARGYIVTNRHVVNRAQRIVVSVPGDPHTYFGRLVGMDMETDLALVKIRAPHPLPVAPLGNSDRLAVGDWVVAIGSPFGLEDTVTAGIVSALHRAMDPSQQFESFIQTDAPINPGNSGGPLINLAGEVVGINTSIYTYTDGYQGVGFALPSGLVEQIYPQLLRQGHVTRGSIGVYFESVIDPAVRRVYHLDHGVPLSQVAPGGPAAQAGLQPGDVVTSLNGVPIANGDALMNAVVFMPIGQRLQVGYVRHGQARQVAVAVADRDRIYPPPAGSPPAPAPPPAPPDLGLSLQPTRNGMGAQVKAVAPDSFADSIGIRSDDVVLEINHQTIHSLADVGRIAAAVHSGEDVAMVLRRPNGDGTDSRWLVGGTVPPQPTAAAVGPPR